MTLWISAACNIVWKILRQQKFNKEIWTLANEVTKQCCRLLFHTPVITCCELLSNVNSKFHATVPELQQSAFILHHKVEIWTEHANIWHWVGRPVFDSRQGLRLYHSNPLWNTGASSRGKAVRSVKTATNLSIYFRVWALPPSPQCAFVG